MLVYCSKLHFRPATLSDALEITTGWLSAKIGKGITVAGLQEKSEVVYPAGHRIGYISETVGTTHLAGIRYSHPDRDISGRQWQVEVGFRKEFETDELEATVLLQTSEISARVITPIQPTRPGVVAELLRGLRPAPHTVGLTLAQFGGEDAYVLSEIIEHVGRKTPLVLVSPTSEGTFLANPHRLRDALTGIAEVGVIPTPEDAQWLSRRLGQERTAWGGAVKVLYPLSSSRSVAYRYYTSDQLRTMLAAGQSTDSEILSVVLHRTNLPLSRTHLGHERIREEGLRARLAAARLRSTKHAQVEDEVRYLEEILAVAAEAERDYKARIAVLEKEYEELEAQVEQLEDDARRAHYECEALKHQLNAADGDQGELASEEDVAAGRGAMARLFRGEGTVEDALTVVDSLFGDCAIVLPTAWDSVKASRGFRHTEKAFSLLLELVGPYRDKLASGVADGVARAGFGRAYAATESDSVKDNAMGRARRTFLYRGAPTPMFAHLKIGVKDSPAETLRVHFLWDAEVKKIVIGHCGPHLDFD